MVEKLEVGTDKEKEELKLQVQQQQEQILNLSNTLDSLLTDIIPSLMA